MREPRCIRYFSNRQIAISAVELLIQNGFEAEMKEQKIGSVTADKNGLPLKFRLYVERKKINKIAKLLAEKLRK